MARTGGSLERSSRTGGELMLTLVSDLRTGSSIMEAKLWAVSASRGA